MSYEILNGSGYPTIHIKNVSDNSLVRSISRLLQLRWRIKENYKEDFKRITLEKE